METIPTTYNIKVPIYISESKIDELGDYPFKEYALSQELLINNLVAKINKHNSTNQTLSTAKRNKTAVKNIGTVNYEIVAFGSDKGLLLKITSFNSNLFGNFYEKDKRIDLSKDDKIGSEHYYAIIYPHIFGISNREYKWIVLVYEDPNKDNYDIVLSIKLVLKKILNIDSVNIKLPDFIKKLKTLDFAELSMKLISVNFEENEVDYEIKGYEIETKSKTIIESKYRNVPISKLNQVVEDRSFFEKYARRILRISSGKHELKLEQEYLDDAKRTFQQSAEEIFNYTSEINYEDVESGKIYDTEYIVNKIRPVLENFLTTQPND